MSLWRLEWLRLVRTRRLVALVGIFLVSGLLGPPTARYLEEVIRRFGGGIQVQAADPRPVDGLVQYLQWFGQLGVLVVAVVAAGALAFDASTEMGIFLRTRVADLRRLLLPRVVVPAAASVGAFALGTAAAWYETAVLLGPLEVVATLHGAALTALYLVFVVAVVAVAVALVRGVVGAVALAVGVLVVLPVAGLLPSLRPWLPSTLLGAVADVPMGVSADGGLRAALVTVLLVPVLVALAAALLARREL